MGSKKKVQGKKSGKAETERKKIRKRKGPNKFKNLRGNHLQEGIQKGGKKEKRERFEHLKGEKVFTLEQCKGGNQLGA